MTEKIWKFGKSSARLLEIKKTFFEDNDEFLRYQKVLSDLYVAQPRRTKCMCCAGPISGRSFAKQGIDYVVCGQCGHLNGAHEDTDAFAAAVYTGTGTSEYGRLFYTAQDRGAYERRREAIYDPKVDFLLTSLRQRGEDPSALTFCDYGAGSGYLVAALLNQGVSAFGYEVSESQVTYGNEMLGRVALHPLSIAESESRAATLDCDVMVLIGVLEHLQRPRDLLRSVLANPRIRYLMISVPLYSPTVFLEMIFPDVMQRQLSGGHTHLYSEQSLTWMATEFKIDPIAEWWFGTDLVDLYRSVLVRLQHNPDTAAMVPAWHEKFAPMIDDLQLVLDHRKQASEVHVIYRIR